MVRYILLNLVFIVSVITNTNATAQNRACEQIVSDIDASSQSFNLEKLQAYLVEAKAPDTQCTSKQLFCMGRRASRLIINEVFTRSSAGVGDGDLKPLLEVAYDVGPTWKAAFYLAEAEEDGDKSDQTRFDRSAKYFQLAINHIDEIDKFGSVCAGETEELPNQSIARMILDRAAKSVLLAKTFVKPPITRSGEIGGVYLPSLRGVSLERRPVPTTFEFNSVAFTPKGKAAAKFLLEFINTKNLSTLTLLGHTDKKGNDAFNCTLSKKRLAAVKGFLRKNGYTGEISTAPRGEFEPVKLDDPGQYSEEETDRLNRRVELALNYNKSAKKLCE